MEDQFSNYGYVIGGVSPVNTYLFSYKMVLAEIGMMGGFSYLSFILWHTPCTYLRVGIIKFALMVFICSVLIL